MREQTEELAAQLRGLMIARLLVMTLLGLLLAWAHRAGTLGVAPGPPLAVLAGTWIYTLLYWRGFRFGLGLPALVRAQLGLDLVLETILVIATGGAASPLVMLYFLTTFTAGAFLDRRGAVATALVAAAAYAGVAWFAGGEGGREPLATVGYDIGAHGGALIVLALLSSILQDRTHRSRQDLVSAEEALERVSARTDRVLENMPIGVITAAADGRVVTANPAARAILELADGEDFEGRDLADYLRSLSASLAEAVEGVLATRRWATREEIVLRDGSTERPCGISVAPLTGGDGSLEGAIVTITDLREIRRMEKEMRRSEQLANLGELAAGVAHEIRNPLASISGAVQVLRAEVRGDGDEAELMDLIVRESDRLNRIIDGVLDYTRDHSSTRNLHDLSVTAREVVRMVLHDKRLTLGKTLLVEFPSDQDFQAEFEEGGMKQVFYNLVRNALEAMGVGGILRITGQNSGDGSIHVVFRDTGEGIPPHELDHIFKPFHTSKAGGTGMGLSIASRIVESNGGTIRAKSTSGMGTAITIELPAPPFRGSSPEPAEPKREESFHDEPAQARV